jgi:cell division protein FtsB
MKRRIFQANKTGRQIIYDRLILLALLVVLLVVSRGAWLLWNKNAVAKDNLVSSEIHLKQLEDRKRMLESKLSKIQTPRGLEEEIRTNFSVVKPGEKVINIVDPDKATTTATATPVKKRSWWQIF